eukprot:6329440-Amphidinium_carterae.4
MLLPGSGHRLAMTGPLMNLQQVTGYTTGMLCKCSAWCGPCRKVPLCQTQPELAILVKQSGQKCLSNPHTQAMIQPLAASTRQRTNTYFGFTLHQTKKWGDIGVRAGHTGISTQGSGPSACEGEEIEVVNGRWVPGFTSNFVVYINRSMKAGKHEKTLLVPVRIYSLRWQLENGLLQVCGLAIVQFGDAITPTSILDAEEKLLTAYYHWPLDAAKLQVQSIAALEEPVRLELEQHGPHGDFFSRASASRHATFPHFTTDMNHRSVRGAGAIRTISDVVEPRPGCDVHSCPLLVLPAPVAQLVCRGCFRHLLWLSRWTVRQNSPVELFAAWPAAACKAKAGLHRSTQQGMPLTGQSLHGVSDFLRYVSSAIPDEERDQAGMLIEQLERWGDALHPQKKMTKLLTKTKYSAHTLLQSLSLVFSTRACKGYMANVRAALRTTLPHELKPLADAFADTLPSVSTMQRARFQVDLALTVCQGVLLDASHDSHHACPSQSKAVRYWWCDASPLRGREWLWLQEVSLPKDQLLMVFRSTHQLIHAVRDIGDVYSASRASAQSAESVESFEEAWEQAR